MKAISQDTLGGPDVLHEIDLPKPVPGPTEVLVRVRAAGLNPTDWKHRSTGGLLGKPPFVLGWDVSGVVESVGMGAAIYKPGDEVFGMLRYPVGHGAFAQYVTAPSRTFAPKPVSLDHTQAAGVPLAGLTAWQALVDVARVRDGDRVLVHAAAGGVGHLAVQIAKARGAYVYGTASAAKHDFLRRIGVDQVIDYRSTDFTTVVEGLDAVIDTIGGDYGPRSITVLRPGGVIVSLVSSMEVSDLREHGEKHGVRVESMLCEPDLSALRSLAALIGAGRLRVAIAAVFPLEELAKAMELGESGRTTGKIVLTVD
ncbi:NADP-dependent oxidoreductase [Herbidospora mongoliensis]|uniref:NADP-dependent oxidoreductase n=1 Tax=Herbidospora mongoliensis TaxID=688067 RepID=UPI0008338BFD|nr:NADP-dependent oxidoreductase [Herbidospora mongoliensis]